MSVRPGAKDAALQEPEESLRGLWHCTQPLHAPAAASCASRPASVAEHLLELAVGPDVAEQGLGSFA
eukprot:10416987-Heterocapsa_arctica.AAC.1